MSIIQIGTDYSNSCRFDYTFDGDAVPYTYSTSQPSVRVSADYFSRKVIFIDFSRRFFKFFLNIFR